MVERHLTIPHQFKCVTDDEIEGVECVKLDWTKHIPGTVYMRLGQHNGPWAREHIGERILNMDVDVCITANMDKLASRPEDFVIWRNPNYPTPLRAFYQSSIQLFTPGARQCLYDDFEPKLDAKWVNWRYGGREQAWITERLQPPWDEAYFSDLDGVYGAGRLGGNGVYTDLPDNAVFVSFPGARAPWQKEIQEKHTWLKEHYK
jgi:hypothetical protein